MRSLAIPEPRADVEAGLSNCERLGAARGLIAAISCAVPYFRQFDRDGNPVREVLIERAAAIRSDAELDRLMAEMREDLGGGESDLDFEAFIHEQRDAQRYRHPFDSLRHDEARDWIALLEEESEPDRGATPTLHLFDRDGRYTAAVRDSLFWWDYDFLDGDIVALTRDAETGLVSVARYRIVISSDPL